MRDRSLRAQLLRLLFLPVAGILAIGAIAAYYLAHEPAKAAYDASLVNAALALGEAIRMRGGVATIDLPSDADRVLRTDRYDKVFYVVRDPSGVRLAGDAGIPLPAYDYVIKCSHVFNVLDARGAVSVTERVALMKRTRDLAVSCAHLYVDSREKLGFPLLKKEETVEVADAAR